MFKCSTPILGLLDILQGSFDPSGLDNVGVEG